MKRYFHELTDQECQELLDKHATYSDVSENYKQPDWCSHNNALLDCWSLLDLFNLRHKISKDYCKNCDCFKNK